MAKVIELSEAKSDCPRCAELRSQLLDLRRERDDALLALAREREEVNALRVGYPASPSIPPPRVWYRRPDPPLRYVLVDRVNDAVKHRLGPLHASVKWALARVRGRKAEE